jgi:hypothetical protein
MTTNIKTVKRILVSPNLPTKTASLIETATAPTSPPPMGPVISKDPGCPSD